MKHLYKKNKKKNLLAVFRSGTVFLVSHLLVMISLMKLVSSILPCFFRKLAMFAKKDRLSMCSFMYLISYYLIS